MSKLRPSSLTLRVMLFVALAIGLSLVLIARLVLGAVEHHFLAQDLDELRVVAGSIESTLETAAPEPSAQATALAGAVSGHHGIFYRVLGPNDELLFASQGFDMPSLPADLVATTGIDGHGLRVWEFDGKPYRGAWTSMVIDGGQYRAAIAMDMDFHRHFLDNFRRSLWLIMLGAGALTLLAAWFGVHQGLRPLRGLSQAMSKIQSDRLELRLEPEKVPLELKELVLSFNHMLERLQQGFSRLTHFSADIAHELRTPLSNIITQTQVGLGRARSAQEYRELLYSNLEEQERLAKMINGMLWLAKSDNGLIRPRIAPLDLVQEVLALFEFFEALAQERQLELVLLDAVGRTYAPGAAGPDLQADRELLRRALSNLLSNAIRHAEPGSRVGVRLSVSADARVDISVENAGADIEAHHLPHLFERFYRADPSRQRHTEGAGLGLAIVQSIIKAHGGEISVSSQGGSTRFSLSLPGVTPAP
jgi:two-component system, OmpR family, heavy metal sensor histidine kinase CusS